ARGQLHLEHLGEPALALLVLVGQLAALLRRLARRLYFRGAQQIRPGGAALEGGDDQPVWARRRGRRDQARGEALRRRHVVVVRQQLAVLVLDAQVGVELEAGQVDLVPFAGRQLDGVDAAVALAGRRESVERVVLRQRALDAGQHGGLLQHRALLRFFQGELAVAHLDN